MTAPTTWEEATEEVAAALPAFSADSWTLDEVLREVEETLDILREGTEYEEALFRNLAWYGAVGYVQEKWPDKGGARGNYPGFVEGGCNSVVRDVLVLLPKKQHDYGPDNILWGGVQGVVVRAHDKLARIKNLKKRQNESPLVAGADAYNEPLADSYFDLIGYGIVGAMLVKGTFQLPLEADLAEAWYVDHDTDEPLLEKHPGPFFSEQQQNEIREIVGEEIVKRQRVINPWAWPLRTVPIGELLI